MPFEEINELFHFGSEEKIRYTLNMSLQSEDVS